jgi:hypothetical protein
VEPGCITIVQVIYKNILWVTWNIKNTQTLNSSSRITYLLIDNDRYVLHLRNKFYLRYFTYFKGIENLRIVRNNKENLQLKGSHQHASGLDVAGRLVDTKFVVIQDPDCIVLKKRWIEFLDKLIDSKDLDLIGTPEAESVLNLSIKDNNRYKFISPLPFLIYGKSEVIFANSFEPNFNSGNLLDTGFKLSFSCINGDYSYELLHAFSTRSIKSNIGFINKYSCTFYTFNGSHDKTYCVHFGRGSNRFGKNRDGLKMLTKLIRAFLDPVIFRLRVNKYILTSMKRIL